MCLVFSHPGPSGLACPPSVGLTTSTRDAVCTWGLQLLVVLHRIKAAGNPGKQSNAFVPGQHSSNLDEGNLDSRKVTEDRFSLGTVVLTGRQRAQHICF